MSDEACLPTVSAWRWEHTGFFGAFLFYWPSRQLVITGSLNQANSSAFPLAEELAQLLRDTHTT